MASHDGTRMSERLDALHEHAQAERDVAAQASADALAQLEAPAGGEGAEEPAAGAEEPARG